MTTPYQKVTAYQFVASNQLWQATNASPRRVEFNLACGGLPPIIAEMAASADRWHITHGSSGIQKRCGPHGVYQLEAFFNEHGSPEGL